MTSSTPLSLFNSLKTRIRTLFTHTQTANLTFDTGADRVTVETDVASTLTDRYVGLSNHDSLEEGDGLLFIHPFELTHSYVMRNMSFPIDIIFLASDNEVSEVHYHAEPDTSWNPFHQTTYKGVGKYVLEVPAGWAEKHNIHVGTKYNLQLSVSE